MLESDPPTPLAVSGGKTIEWTAEPRNRIQVAQHLAEMGCQIDLARVDDRLTGRSTLIQLVSELTQKQRRVLEVLMQEEGRFVHIVEVREKSGISGQALGGVLATLRTSTRKRFGREIIRVAPWIKLSAGDFDRTYLLDLSTI